MQGTENDNVKKSVPFRKAQLTAAYHTYVSKIILLSHGISCTILSWDIWRPSLKWWTKTRTVGTARYLETASLANQYAKVNIPDSMSDALMNAQLLSSQTLAHLQGDNQGDSQRSSVRRALSSFLCRSQDFLTDGQQINPSWKTDLCFLWTNTFGWCKNTASLVSKQF